MDGFDVNLAKLAVASNALSEVLSPTSSVRVLRPLVDNTNTEQGARRRKSLPGGPAASGSVVGGLPTVVRKPTPPPAAVPVKGWADPWSPEETTRLTAAVQSFGEDWEVIQRILPARSSLQLQMKHAQLTLKEDLPPRQPWTQAEDDTIRQCIAAGLRRWVDFADIIPGRNRKQIRERWHNYLNPDIKKTAWTPEETGVMMDLQAQMGNKWAEISKQMGRSEKDVKNRWYSTLGLKRTRNKAAAAAATTTTTTTTTVPEATSPDLPAAPMSDDPMGGGGAGAGAGASSRSLSAFDALCMTDKPAPAHAAAGFHPVAMTAAPPTAATMPPPAAAAPKRKAARTSSAFTAAGAAAAAAAYPSGAHSNTGVAGTAAAATADDDMYVELSHAKAARAKARNSVGANRRASTGGMGRSAAGWGRWTDKEDTLLRQAVKELGTSNWHRVANEFFNGSRTELQCQHRWDKGLKPGLVKGPWSRDEDDKIRMCMAKGITRWVEVAAHVQGRNGKQCRERWHNHLNPAIFKGPWLPAEDALLDELHAELGNRWCEIAKRLNNRSENDIKNRWNCRSKRRGGGAKAAAKPPTKRGGARRQSKAAAGRAGRGRAAKGAAAKKKAAGAGAGPVPVTAAAAPPVAPPTGAVTMVPVPVQPPVSAATATASVAGVVGSHGVGGSVVPLPTSAPQAFCTADGQQVWMAPTMYAPPPMSQVGTARQGVQPVAFMAPGDGSMMASAPMFMMTAPPTVTTLQDGRVMYMFEAPQPHRR